MIEQSATYGSLMAVAARHVAWASSSLTTEPIGDRASAWSAYDARRDLLVAAGRHLLFLVGGPNRLSGRAAGLTPEPADRAALALSRALIALEPQRRGEDPPVRGVPASSWHAAVRAMGAARDLVSTHRDPLGADRSPDSDVLEDAGERAASYVAVADLVAVVSSADRDLALRAAQAGMTWKAAERALPDMSAVDDAVRALRHEASLRSAATASPRLQRLTLARPGVTATSPSGVLMQRVGRLRQGAWTLARHERRSSAADLIEYAAAAVILHTHLAAHGDQLGDPETARAWVEARAGWAEQHRHLARFTDGTPATAGLRAEVAALPPAAALALPVTRDATGVRAYGAPSLSTGDMRRLAIACSELAELNAGTLQALVGRGALYIDARHLPGDRITDDVALVEAKMHGRYVPSCPSDATDALAAYARLSAVQPRHPERTEPGRSAPARTAERHLLRA